jgi:hypothetical protein
MPPYAQDERTSRHHNENRRYSTERVSPPLKRHLYLIPERFVRFGENVKVLPYKTRTDFTKQEVASIWYTKQELAQFKQDTRKVVRHQRGLLPPRGLEQRTTQGFQQALRNRLSALTVVLQIQYVRDDPNHIAKAYREVTKHCQLEAIDIAMRDHVEANNDAEGPYQEDADEGPECLACFPLSPRWLSSLLTTTSRKNRVPLMSHQESY